MPKSVRNHRERQIARALAATLDISYQRALQELRARRGPANVTAEEHVRDILDSIAQDRWLNLHVPHGFSTVAIFSEDHPNVFSPAIGHARIDACLRLPVLYTPKYGRAHLATRANLEVLRNWIDERARAAGIKLVGWQVKPEVDPKPEGDPDGPDQQWRVLASFEDHRSYRPRLARAG